MRLAFLLLVIPTVMLPTSAAQADDGATPYTQVVDPSGDVEYLADPTRPARDYLDIVATEVSYESASDNVLITIHLVDLRGLLDLDAAWIYECSASFHVRSNGQESGGVAFAFSVRGDDVDRYSHAYWYEVGTAGPVWHFEGRAVTMAHRLDVLYERPGILRFEVARSQLAWFGDALSHPWVSCREALEPSRDVYMVYRHENWDTANSDGRYDLSSLTPEAIVDAPDEPWALHEWAAPAVGLAFIAKLAIVGWKQYARLARHKILENEIRSRLLDVITHNPGIRYRELLRASGLAPGALGHHLEILERGHYVKKVLFHGFTMYVTGGTAASVARTVGALRPPTASWIFTQVRKRPGVTARELADERDIHPSSILYHVRRLVEADLLVRERGPGGLGLRVAPAQAASVPAPSTT